MCKKKGKNERDFIVVTQRELNILKKIPLKVARFSVIHLLFDDGSVGFDGGGANLMPPGGGGNAPVAPVRVRRDDSLPSFFYNLKAQINHIYFMNRNDTLAC